MMASALRGRSGFTLVELMVVVGIIAVLAAILFPVFGQAREAARKAACAGHLYQIGVGLQMYARDHDGRLPPHHNEFGALNAMYTRDPAIFRCLSDEALPQGLGVGGQGLGIPGDEAAAAFSSYQYRAGLTMEDRPDIPVAADWEFRHSDGAVTLYLSGSVKWFRRQSWTPVAPGPRPLPPGAQRVNGATSYLILKDGQVTGVVESPESEQPPLDSGASE